MKANETELPDSNFTQGLHDGHWYYTRRLPPESVNDWIGPFMTKACAIQHSKDGTFRVID